MRRHGLSFDLVEGADEVLLSEESCTGIYGAYTTVVLSYCDTRVGFVVERYVLVSDLCSGCL